MRSLHKSYKATGSTSVIITAFLIVLAWGLSESFFDYSETWQLVINTGTTIITFLMVFLIQKTQNKDSLAIQIKLNELVAAHQYARDHMVDVEDMTEEEMEIIEKYYAKLAELGAINREKAFKASWLIVYYFRLSIISCEALSIVCKMIFSGNPLKTSLCDIYRFSGSNI